MPKDFQTAVYLLASARNDTLYVGVTSNLIARIHQHRTGAVPGYARDHGLKRLVWWSSTSRMDSAILREKRLKKWNRAWKLNLIEAANPEWNDLADELGFAPLR